MAKVSIIVPVFNVEKYLKYCIESLIQQTYQNIEIILVNDGSTDNSGQICDVYATKDNRIKVLHKENGGQSDARNSGIRIAQGDYVGFVDADDFAEVTMFEKLYSSAILNDCEISVCDYYRYFSEENYNECNQITKQGVYKGKDEILLRFIGNKLADYEKSFQLASVWRCLYSRKLIANIEFSPIRNIEDRLFNIEVFIKANNIFYLTEALYYYNFNPNSITKSYDKDMARNLIYSDRKVISLLKNKSFNYNEELFTSRLVHYISIIRNEAMFESNKSIYKSINTISMYGRILNLNDSMFKEVRKHMKIPNKIIYQLLKYRCTFFILILFKVRRKYKKEK